MVKKNSCVFISGTGSNLKALIQSSRRYNFPINIKLIVSNKKNALGLIFAKKLADFCILRMAYRVIMQSSLSDADYMTCFVLF